VKIKVIAFDLDDTLLDTSRLLLPIAGRPEFFERIGKPLPLMAGALEILKSLTERYTLALVTQGATPVQKQKIASLGISGYFKKIYYVDVSANETKKTPFANILNEFQIHASELLSVGNRRSTDIRWAKFLGAKTCLFNYGEHRHETASNEDEIPDFQIESLTELVQVCHL